MSLSGGLCPSEYAFATAFDMSSGSVVVFVVCFAPMCVMGCGDSRNLAWWLYPEVALGSGNVVRPSSLVGEDVEREFAVAPVDGGVRMPSNQRSVRVHMIHSMIPKAKLSVAPKQGSFGFVTTLRPAVSSVSGAMYKYDELPLEAPPAVELRPATLGMKVWPDVFSKTCSSFKSR